MIQLYLLTNLCLKLMVGGDLFLCYLEEAVKDKAIEKPESQQENHRKRETLQRFNVSVYRSSDISSLG